MSIHDDILRLEADGKLHCLESLLTGEDTVRTLWVSSDVHAAVMPPYHQGRSARDRERLSEFRQFLDAFLEHGHLSVAQDPDDKPDFAMIARVHPVDENFWDLRVTSPRPGIRAFGAFAAFNTFVVLTWEYREAIEVGAFDAEVQNCIETWKELFGQTPPFSKPRLSEYLSEFTEYKHA